ncbi:hypothetical protein [Cellulophaga fucicola]|uniref:hypothetical protein n=1 Tax=Cellulophaga fucicola TaxID=76595 RepID=UPI003EBED363
MRKVILLCLLLVVSAIKLNAQDCKVNLKSINETYIGDCKKGKADGNGKASGIDSYEGEFKKGYPDGNGTYTWGNGDVFKGIWKKGKKNGEGTLVQNKNSKTETITGYWKNDIYAGRYKVSSKKIDKSSNISSYSITHSSDDVNKIRFYIKENQKMITNPQFNVIMHNGNFMTITSGREYYELVNVTFPFKAKVLYKQEYVEFELFNEGLWTVRIDVTSIKGLNTN